MVTTEEVGRVPLFAALDEAEREQLSRVAADISLESGEYAAPQGSQAALFAVLDGRIEPVQRSGATRAGARGAARRGGRQIARSGRRRP